MDWNEVTALATVAATVITLGAFVATAIYVISAVHAFQRDQFVGVTGELFAIFQSRDFMDDQLWIIHRLDAKNWPEFIAAHRGDAAEAAFHRVGSVYNRLGNMIRMKLISPDDVLPTVGPYVIAVWNKIEPLVLEARRLENSTLFIEFERIVPDCYECYIPALGPGTEVVPFAQRPAQAGQAPRSANTSTREQRPLRSPESARPADSREPQPVRINLDEAREKVAKNEAVFLDVRQPSNIAEDPRTLPGALRIAPDQIQERYRYLPRSKEIIAYCA
jgi:hypothetical protein